MNAACTLPPARIPKMFLDVRGLTPPEPMQRVLEALAQLSPRATLVVRIHREPLLLFQLIDPDGWSRSSRELAANDWQICIWRGARDG